MKKTVIVIAMALLAGLATFFLSTRSHATHAPHLVMDDMPELGWLRTELNLTDNQFAQVQALHTAYRPKCVEMCRRNEEARDQILSLAKANRQLTPEFRAALDKRAKTRLQCQEAVLEHIYQTAALLNKEQADRYLDALLPYALDLANRAHVR